MVKRSVRPLRRWPALEGLITRSTTWFLDDFERFAHPSETDDDADPVGAQPPAMQPQRPGPPLSIAPETFERRFTRLHADGRLYEMWDMLAEDAQRAWGSRERFMRRMPMFDKDTELVDVEALDLAMLDSWIDLAHGRVYSNVARMVMRYRIRHSGSESSFDRQVHLIPAAAGWRTLCYPTSSDKAAGSAAGR